MLATTRQAVLDELSYAYFRNALFERAGITLAEGKRDLAQSRLGVRLTALGMTTYAEYASYLRSLPQNDPEWQQFINELTTNKTDFFREFQHFEFLAEEALPELRARLVRQVRIWSAACSTGEEPYSIGMFLRGLGIPDQDWSLVGSDIDTEVLATAKRGVYPTARIKEIPEQFQRFGVDVGTGEIANWMRIKPALKLRIEFRRQNLVENPLPWRNHFDIVMCRNVMIYFSPETTAAVVRNLYESAAPGAYMLTGHSESLQGIPNDWQYVRPSIYRKKR